MKPPKNSHPDGPDEDDVRHAESLLEALRKPTKALLKKLEKVADRIPELSRLLSELQELPLLNKHPAVAGVFSERLAEDHTAIVGALDHALVSIDSFMERVEEFAEIVRKIKPPEAPGAEDESDDANQ